MAERLDVEALRKVAEPDLAALESLFREAMRVGVDTAHLSWKERQPLREQWATELAKKAAALLTGGQGNG